MKLADVQSLVNDLVRDTDQVIASSASDTAIAHAVLRYSADAPRRAVADVDVDEDGNLPAPAGFTSASKLLRVEYPVGNRPPSYVPAGEIEIYETPDALMLVPSVEFPAGATMRLTYTAAHTLDDSDDTTIPGEHVHAVAALAAADLCGQLAANYSNEAAPTIGADTVDHKGKSDRWRARKRELDAEYVRVVGSKPNDRTKAASVDVAVTRADSLGRPRLFHPPTSWRRA
jgi:hypothetical protein